LTGGTESEILAGHGNNPNDRGQEMKKELRKAIQELKANQMKREELLKELEESLTRQGAGK
jgi:hypothetical protein